MLGNLQELDGLRKRCCIQGGLQAKRIISIEEREYISIEGTLKLIRCTTLCNLPIYYMSLLVIPRKAKLRLEKI